MRRIAIVGAGQAGLQLALGLRAEGYEVTVVSARTAEEIRAGRVLSTQVMFGPALALERAAGLRLWDEQAPRIDGLDLRFAAGPGTPPLSFSASFDGAAQSVDQRLKMAGWLELFEERGGRVEHRAVAADGLGPLAAEYDLTLVAAGRGALAEVFTRDDRHSPFEAPQRTLACVYLHGVTAADEQPDGMGPRMRVLATPEAGECIVMPALTLSGPCDILLWEAAPGGPYDCWQDRPGAEAVMERSLELMRTYAPWEYERFAAAKPTDAQATLFGSVVPTVRHPVAEVGPGSYVLGMADTVVVNDPVAGQGANNAAHCAASYLRSVLDHGEQPFDRPWMQHAFAAFWERARHASAFSNLLLAPPEHVGRALDAASRHPEVAHRLANVYVDPSDAPEWIMDADRTAAYLAAVGQP
ncbi:styrene monooxygenase/indole monooxygenase family protein [Streptomyces sp. NPDC050610]|uniref:styrene monooxygenase/indole monooxygenase family protein n=1 Tax=Streptomyces sp. NPDC050610 TaxID=3157097 RepID=UPI0034299B34